MKDFFLDQEYLTDFKWNVSIHELEVNSNQNYGLVGLTFALQLFCKLFVALDLGKPTVRKRWNKSPLPSSVIITLCIIVLLKLL